MRPPEWLIWPSIEGQVKEPTNTDEIKKKCWRMMAKKTYGGRKIEEKSPLY